MLFPNTLALVVRMRSDMYYVQYYKIQIRSSCEIDDFVATHFSKLCVILRSRVLRVVCPRRDIGRRLPLQLQLVHQGQQGDASQSVRGNYETRF